MKYIPNAMKFGIQSRSSLLTINMIFEIADIGSKLNTKFGTQNKSSMLLINILFEIDDLDPKLQICEIWSQN